MVTSNFDDQSNAKDDYLKLERLVASVTKATDLSLESCTLPFSKEIQPIQNLTRTSASDNENNTFARTATQLLQSSRWCECCRILTSTAQ